MHEQRTQGCRPHAVRININQDFEVRDWADRFRVSPEEVREAIRAVGDRAPKIEAWLRRRDC